MKISKILPLVICLMSFNLVNPKIFIGKYTIIKEDFPIVMTYDPIPGTRIVMQDSLLRIKHESVVMFSGDVVGKSLLIIRNDSLYSSLDGSFTSIFSKNDTIQDNDIIIKCKIGDTINIRMWDNNRTEINPENYL